MRSSATTTPRSACSSFSTSAPSPASWNATRRYRGHPGPPSPPPPLLPSLPLSARASPAMSLRFLTPQSLWTGSNRSSSDTMLGAAGVSLGLPLPAVPLPAAPAPARQLRLQTRLAGRRWGGCGWRWWGRSLLLHHLGTDSPGGPIHVSWSPLGTRHRPVLCRRGGAVGCWENPASCLDPIETNVLTGCRSLSLLPGRAGSNCASVCPSPGEYRACPG